MADSSSKNADAPAATPPQGEASFWEAVKTVKIEDFKHVNEMPCSRSSLLYGMGAGFGSGILRFAYKGSVLSASNYAVGSFCAVSLLAWEFCQYEQRRRKQLPVTVMSGQQEQK
ncbi:hypothetical protein RI367_000181 [Sorochytrium milnesiophthora]